MTLVHDDGTYMVKFKSGFNLDKVNIKELDIMATRSFSIKNELGKDTEFFSNKSFSTKKFSEKANYKASDFKIGDEFIYEFTDPNAKGGKKQIVNGKVVDHFGDGIFVQLDSPISYEPEKNRNRAALRNWSPVVTTSSFDLYDDEENEWGSMACIVKKKTPELKSKQFSEIKSDSDFRKYAHTIMSNAHGDNYSKEITDKVVDGLLADNKNADYGELIGRLKSGLGR